MLAMIPAIEMPHSVKVDRFQDLDLAANSGASDLESASSVAKTRSQMGRRLHIGRRAYRQTKTTREIRRGI